MIDFENTNRTFSAGTLCLLPANFSVLSNEQKRSALISSFPVALTGKYQVSWTLFRFLVLATVFYARIKRNPE